MLCFSLGLFALAPHPTSPRSRGERYSGVTPLRLGERMICLRHARRLFSHLRGEVR